MSQPKTPRDLYAYFRDTLGITWSQAREYFRELEALAARQLNEHGEFTVPGIVRIAVQRRAARVFRDPVAGKNFKVPARAVLRARVSGDLLTAIIPERSPSAVVRLRTTRTKATMGRRTKGPEVGRVTRGAGGAGHGVSTDGLLLPSFPSTLGNADVVRVFYATDRTPATRRPGHFTSRRANTLTFGWADVSIPKDHRLAAIERPSVWRLAFFEDPARHFVIIRRSVESSRRFWRELSNRNVRSALVFIHGYNVRFDDALYRTAQIAYDLEFDGNAILYSWASHASLRRYAADVANSEFTIISLKQFLLDVADKSGADTVHVIAHSMGNKALTAALYQVAISGTRDSQLPRIHNLILTAPDIDAGVFRQIAAAFQRTARRTTLYVSSNDKALQVSMRLHRYPRAGDASDIVIVPGVETIDATNLDTDSVGHCYYGDNRSVLCDIYQMMKHDAPPALRFGLRGVPINKPSYWQFRP